MKQLKLLAHETSAYGGELMKTRKGRARPRPLAVKHSMHLVLRSSKAKGKWSFFRASNRARIMGIIERFSKKYGVRILSLANVGNHLHFHIQLTNRRTYTPYIRAITAAIAMAITGRSRWNKTETGRFWDYRPFTRIVIGWRAVLNLRDYIRINRLEGFGYHHELATFIVKNPPKLSSA